MYLGTIETTIPVHSQRYRPGLGTFSYVAGFRTETQHKYLCEYCGRENAFSGDRVAEPYYCRCGQLVTVR